MSRWASQRPLLHFRPYDNVLSGEASLFLLYRPCMCMCGGEVEGGVHGPLSHRVLMHSRGRAEKTQKTRSFCLGIAFTNFLCLKSFFFLLFGLALSYLRPWCQFPSVWDPGVEFATIVKFPAVWTWVSNFLLFGHCCQISYCLDVLSDFLLFGALLLNPAVWIWVLNFLLFGTPVSNFLCLGLCYFITYCWDLKIRSQAVRNLTTTQSRDLRKGRK